jgi:hypothetical protein
MGFFQMITTKKKKYKKKKKEKENKYTQKKKKETNIKKLKRHLVCNRVVALQGVFSYNSKMHNANCVDPL